MKLCTASVYSFVDTRETASIFSSRSCHLMFQYVETMKKDRRGDKL